MQKRWVRVVAALISTVAAYWVYALAVVPWIEPPAKLRSASLPPPPLQSRLPIERFVPRGAWELNHPKILETAQGALLFKDYKPRDDGRIELNPFTLILHAANPPSGGDPAEAEPETERPLVLRAPEGAVLRFDRPLDLTQAKIGRLVGGLLKGEITIGRPASRPGADDSLEITTRNVQIDERRIWTPHEVTFRLGKSYGAGRDLIIQLDPPKNSGRTAAPGGPRSLELVHLDRVRLHLAPQRDVAESPALPPPRDSASTPGGQPTLLEIACQGPFRFDFHEMIATLEDQVDVIRLNGNGPSDQLRCQRLTIHVARGAAPPTDPQEEANGVEAAGSNGAAAKPREKGSAFEIRRIVADGRPVVLQAPSFHAVARGERLTLDVPTRRFTLEDSAAATLQQEGGRIEAPQLRYDLDSQDPTRVGRVWAAGPGRMTAARGEDADKSALEASWGGQLRLERQEDGVPLLSLDGGAEIALNPGGKLTSQAVYVWLRETPRPSPPPPAGGPTPPAPESSGARGASSRSQQAPRRAAPVLPDRMLALGDVRIDSPQMSGGAARMEIWFRHPTPGGAPASPSPRRSREPTPPTRRGEPDRASPQDRLDLHGDLVRVQLYLGKPTRVEYVTIDGHVVLRRISASDPQGTPIQLTGDLLQLENLREGSMRARIDGRPARAAAADASLSGDAIQFSQGDGRLWIDGPGEMTLPPTAPSVLRGVHTPRPAAVAWTGGMDFDGRRVTIEQAVRLHGFPLRKDGGADDVAAETDRLEVELTQAIDFQHLRRPEGLAVRRFLFPHGVQVENRGYDKLGAQQSFDKFAARSLTLDQQTGRLAADGPGWVSSVRRGKDPRLAAGLPLAAAPSPESASPPLTYVRVAFQDGVSGDLAAREVTFHGQVKTIYGPVNGWREEIRADSRAALGEKGVLLTCEVLNLAEMSFGADGRRWLEMEASGNTYVQGGRFAGRGAAVKYVQAKDLLVLEGAPRSDAVLIYQPRAGAAPSQLKARKIFYWPGANSYRFEDVDSLLLDDLRAAQAPGGR